jgi:hypothetical protein
MSAAMDAIWLITQAGLGVYGKDLFKGSNSKIPDRPAPGPFTSVNPTGGSRPIGTHNMIDKPAYVKPSLQIVVRAISSDIAEQRAQALWNLFYPVRNQLVNGTWWVQVTMNQSEPFDLGLDDASRPRWAFNIDIEKRLSPATST